MTGFTLIELMVVVSVFAVLIAAALPSYTDFVRNQRVKTASFELFSTFVLARSEALTRNSTVTVTPSSGTANWAAGWEVRAGTTLLRKQEAFSNIAMMMTGSPPATSIDYNGSGRLSAALTGGIQISATGTGITTRCIKIDPSGRPLTKAETC
jgi:type IV fimbrial biogenesis protein FimT